MAVYSNIHTSLLKLDSSTLSLERKEELRPLINFLQEKVNKDQEIRLVFICTQNSRRSQMSQVWAQALAYHFRLKEVFCYSAGTDATAVYPMIADTLDDAGFQVSRLANTNNPIYSIKYADNEHPVIAFSKKLDNHFNPSSQFAAVMTCSQAGENCPFIEGADLRISMSFEDPKVFDNSPQQKEKYQEKSLQIASEWFYIFSEIRLRNETN